MKKKKNFLTMKYHFKATKEQITTLRFLCHISNSLYNVTLYELRKQYFKSGKICSYFELEKIISEDENYHVLNTYQSLCVIRCAFDNMAKYIDGLEREKYCKEKGYKAKNLKCVMIPKYNRRYGYYPMYTDQVRPLDIGGKKYIKLPLSNIVRTGKVFTKEYNSELLKGFVERFSKYSNNTIKNIFFKIPKELYDKDITQIRVVPDKYGNYFTIEFSYENVKEEVKVTENDSAMGIDLGISNLATCATTDNNYFIIDGKKLKSINQYFNKKVANIRKKLPKGKYHSQKLNRLYQHRNNLVNDYINKAVAALANKVLEYNIYTVVIGWNDGIKTGGIKNNSLKGKIKKGVNQSFVSIPLSKFKNKLREKLTRIGVNVQIINESYTSVCSFVDNEEICYKKEYLGKRTKRSLFISKNNIKIHADINAACNMLAKAKCNSTLLSKMQTAMSRGLTIPYRVFVNI